MSQQTIELSGIVRNLPDNKVIDGAMQELINLRPRDGALRPVGVKVKEASVPADVRYIHNINQKNKAYIGVINGKITYWVYNDITLVNYVVTSIDAVADISFAGSSNILVIGNNVTNTLTTLLFDPSSYTYKVFEKLVPDVPTVTFQTIAKNTDDITKSNAFTVSGLQDPEKWLEEIQAGMQSICASMRAKESELGYLIGNYLIRCAWELFDGTIIMHTIPQMISTSLLDSNGNAPSSPDAPPHFDVVAKSRFTGKSLQYNLNISNGDMTALKALYKGIITSFKLYVTDNKPVLELKEFKPDNTWRSATEPSNQLASAINEWINDEINYYELYSIPLEQMTSNVFVSVDSKDLSDLNLKKIMPTGSFGHHSIYGKSLFAYNQRLWIGNVNNTLYKGQSLTGFFQPGNNPETGVAYEVCITYHLETSQGTKIVQSDWVSLTYYSSVTHKFLFVFKNFIGYPDSRCNKASFYIKLSGDSSRLLYTFPMTPMLGLNFSYSIGIEKLLVYEGWPGFTGSFENFEISAPVVDDSYWDYNRIQATEILNPFFFPAINSYRISNGEIIGLSTNAIALSQGQFGQFPVYCFTTEGIWTMNIGDGDVLINTITPLSREVCNNPSTITQIDGGTVFSTAKGLMIISGVNPVEISEAARGNHLSRISGTLNYEAIANNPNLYQIKDFLCTASILIYLSGAKIAYDHIYKELVISNIAYKYSWVFSLKYKTWFKIGQVFSQFVTDFPNTYGYHTEGATYYKYTMSAEDFTDLVPVHMETRPIKLTARAFKKINRVIVQGMINDNMEFPFSVNLFGSPDKIAWYLMNASNTFGAQKPLLIGRSAFSCQYYILVIGGKVDENASFINIDVDFEERYNNKLR